MTLRSIMNLVKNRTFWRVTGFLLAALLVCSLVCLCRTQTNIPAIIQSWGWVGIVAAILLMAAFHMTPIPSDGLLIMYFKVFGVGWGMLYGWLGSIVSAVCIYLLAQTLGQELLHAVLPEKHLKQIDAWVERKGQRGLFIARLLPIPAFVVNCAAGVLPSVRVGAFLWTAAVTMMVYLGSVGMVYLGATTNTRIWAFIGAAVLVSLWIGSCALSGRTPSNVLQTIRTSLRKGLRRAY